jgi:hypothetical protein
MVRPEHTIPRVAGLPNLAALTACTIIELLQRAVWRCHAFRIWWCIATSMRVTQLAQTLRRTAASPLPQPAPRQLAPAVQSTPGPAHAGCSGAPHHRPSASRKCVSTQLLESGRHIVPTRHRHRRRVGCHLWRPRPRGVPRLLHHPLHLLHMPRQGAHMPCLPATCCCAAAPLLHVCACSTRCHRGACTAIASLWQASCAGRLRAQQAACEHQEGALQRAALRVAAHRQLPRRRAARLLGQARRQLCRETHADLAEPGALPASSAIAFGPTSPRARCLLGRGVLHASTLRCAAAACSVLA